MQNVLKRKNMQKYCGIFARVSVKTLEIFPDIFLEYKNIFHWNPIFFSFIKNIRFRPFWIFLYAKRKKKIFFLKSPQKTALRGGGLRTRNQLFFYAFPKQMLMYGL